MIYNVKYGDVLYAEFKGEHNNMRGVRPCVVVQNKIGNRKSPNVLCIPLTSNIENKEVAYQFIIEASEQNGLKCNSTLLVSQISPLSKQNLISKIGTIEEKYYTKITKAILFSVLPPEYDWRNILYDEIAE